VLAVFNGPHTYISASWYEKPGVASTWNYICVHCKGNIIFRDEEGTYEAIRALTNQYEGMNNPASFSRIDETYIRENLKAITAFDIYVDTMRHVSKLSQNRTEQDQKNIITELHKRQDGQSASIAKEMETRLTDQSTQKR
jgi:transcriptional regulator